MGTKLCAQQYVTTVGIQYKPIIPNGFMRKDGFENKLYPIEVNIKPKSGYSFGMVVRRGLNPRFSVESGINMITRNYSLTAKAIDTNLTFENQFKWISYEIPVQLLVFIRLGEHLYANASGGCSFNFFPSDVTGENVDFYQRTYRYNWAKINLLANLGFEWRTENSGYFYLGASYFQPFSDMAFTYIQYPKTNIYSGVVVGGIRGNYLTLDLRYFFHENPNRLTRKKMRDYRKNKELNKTKRLNP